jgi:hypothetical protein
MQGKSMKFRFKSMPRCAAFLAGALLTTLPLSISAQAQTVVSPPAAKDGSVGATPNGPVRQGTSIIVAAVVDKSGNAENAKEALKFATNALKLVPGYAPLPTSEYAPVSAALVKAGLDTDWGWPFTSTDYQKIGKASTAKQILTLEVTPNGDNFGATAEIYDAKRGALIGFGKASGASLEEAVQSAIIKLSDTVTLSGIVLSKPFGNTARISLGTKEGARGGARIEYLNEAGEPFAFGTLYDIAAGEGLATVAPETAFPRIFVNQKVRLVNNPTKQRALPTSEKLTDKEFNEFEKSFGVAATIAAAAYFLAGGR